MHVARSNSILDDEYSESAADQLHRIFLFKFHCFECIINPLECNGDYSATSNNMKFVHWLLMGRLIHLIQREGDLAGQQPTQAPPRCTKCNSPPINGQCINHCRPIAV